MPGLLMLTTGTIFPLCPRPYESKALRVQESKSSRPEGHVKLYSSMEYGFMECAAETFHVRFSMEDAPLVHHKFLTAGGPLQFKLGTSVVAKTSVQVEFLYVEWRLRCPLRLQRAFVLVIEAAVTSKTETYSYFTQILEVPRFKAVVRCLVRLIALSRCRDRCW